MRTEMEVIPQATLSRIPGSRDAFFTELYESAFPAVASFVSQMNGSFQDAKDIFQDALIIYFERSSESRFTIHVTPERYILGIAKHLWVRKFREDKRKLSLDSFEKTLCIPADFFPTIQSHRILLFLENTGKKCLDLLRGFYYEKNSMKELAIKLGYGSEHSITVQKYKCLEKVRETIKDRSITYGDFFE